MGCDIHMHIEVKIRGKWEHYCAPQIDRSYRLFALLAGVRNEYGVVPISQPKGLPDDLSVVTAYDAELWDDDGHSHSYIRSDEMPRLEDRLMEIFPTGRVDLEMDILQCYLFGNSFAGFARYPEDRPEGLEDVRFVFWFDN